MELPLDKNSYEIIHVLGTGTKATAYAARCIATGKLVCVKITDLETFVGKDFESLRKTLAFWNKSNNENIVRYYGSFIEGPNLWFISEYMDGGSIYSIMQFAYTKGFKDEVLIASILEPVVKFLIYFHENNQIHRDIRPKSLLVSTSGEVKVGSFGIAKDLISGGVKIETTKTNIGDEEYKAPEALIKNEYTDKIDIWSLGITAIELSRGKNPYSGLTHLETVRAITQGPPPEISTKSGFSSKFAEFVKMCLHMNPEKRATAKELLKTAFIKQSKGSKYIASTLMCNMPSLYQRYEMLNKNIKTEQEGDDRWEPFKFDLSLDEGNSKEDEKEAHEEEEEHAQNAAPEPVTIGRFTVTYNPAPESKKKDASDSSSGIPRVSSNGSISESDKPQEQSPTKSSPTTFHVSVSNSSLSECSFFKQYEEQEQKINSMKNRIDGLETSSSNISAEIADLQGRLDAIRKKTTSYI